MKRLILLVLLGGLAYGGYTYYTRTQSSVPSSISSLPLEITHGGNQLDNLTSVLGASIQNAVTTGKDWLSDTTDGASDPIINRALENIHNEVKDLPQEAVDKVKYEFCKDVVTEYENR